MHRYCSILLLCSSLLFSACGSSGGGSTGGSPAGLAHPNTLFSGTYGLTWLEGQADLPDVVGARWGTISGDGAGTSVLEITMNSDGGLLEPPLSDIDYAVHLDRVFELGLMVPGTSLLRGAMSTGGDVFYLASSVSPYWPSLLVGTKQSGVHDDGSLNGSYFYISYSAFAGVGFNVAGWGSVDFDGAGGAAFVTNENLEGALAGPNPLGATYAVAADGRFTLTLGGGDTVAGSIGAGGEVLTAGGGTVAGQDPVFYVFLRRGVGYADTDLDGAWHMVGFMHEFIPNDYVSMHGGAVKEAGISTLNYLGSLNKDGVMEGVPFSTAEITIDAGGTVALEIAPGVFMRGGMSADRRFMSLGGADQPGGDPGFFLFMR